MWQDLYKIVEGVLEDYSHADKILPEKGRITMFVHDYSTKVSGFLDYIGKLELPILDTATNEVIIRINQALYKPDEDVFLIFTFLVR